MDTYKAVFSDIDGTLLTDSHQVTPGTAGRIRGLGRQGIPFVLVSARMPSGIFPIQEAIGISGPIICYGGALILDADRNPIYSRGLSLDLAGQIQDCLPPETAECCFCAYSYDLWIASDRLHPLVRREEEITQVRAVSGQLRELLEPDAPVHKLLGFGPPALLDETAARLRAAFPQCAVYKSAPHRLEIMDGSVSKASAVHSLCRFLGISPQEAAAFGDNYNDMDMLKAVGLGIAMGNAPQPVKEAAKLVTGSNEQEGLLSALNTLFGKGWTNV